MTEYLASAGIIFLLLAGWVGSQAAARRFAARHPQVEESGTRALSEHGSVGCGACAMANACPRDG